MEQTDKHIITEATIEHIEDVAGLFGMYDANIRRVESTFDVRIINRGSDVKITGEPHAVDKARRAVNSLISMNRIGENVTEQSLNYLLTLVEDGRENDISQLSSDTLCISANGKPIRAKTLGQKKYIDILKKNTVTFGIGPAGTGKTYLAAAPAAAALRAKTVRRIIITRPAVEAGEKLGFLPGDLLNKVDPYLRPLYDALFDILGSDVYAKYIERGIIEVAPLAYMRGRTLDDSYIILDEAQNTTTEQMKMFLTRIGFGSYAIVTGDITQVDLPVGKRSGLKVITKILQGIEGIEFCYLTERDVVRHPLVQKIVKAYEKYESTAPEPQRRTARRAKEKE